MAHEHALLWLLWGLLLLRWSLLWWWMLQLLLVLQLLQLILLLLLHLFMLLFLLQMCLLDRRRLQLWLGCSRRLHGLVFDLEGWRPCGGHAHELRRRSGLLLLWWRLETCQ